MISKKKKVETELKDEATKSRRYRIGIRRRAMKREKFLYIREEIIPWDK